MKKALIFLLILLLPLNVLAYSSRIIPGGKTLGIEVQNDGVIIIGFYKINNKLNKNDLKVGDVITKVNNKIVNNVDDLVTEIENNVKNDKVNFTVKRGTKNFNTDFDLIFSGGIYKTGIYVKDTVTGIGTLTYIDPETRIFGALGHEITEGTTGKLIEIKTGSIFKNSITSITRSKVGSPGTKNARFYAGDTFGYITKNTDKGIYGKYTSNLDNYETLEVGKPSDLKIGSANIYTVLKEEEVKSYEINISRINQDANIKNIRFNITSQELIDATGGIVQGMSGSPIIQDNKIYGAVTHVILDSPTSGYGIFITTMLVEGESA